MRRESERVNRTRFVDVQLSLVNEKVKCKIERKREREKE